MGWFFFVVLNLNFPKSLEANSASPSSFEKQFKKTNVLFIQLLIVDSKKKQSLLKLRFAKLMQRF